MKKHLIILFGLVALIAGSFSLSQAGSRYGSQPPAVLSPNLTSPWVLQLQGQPRARQAYVPRARRAYVPRARRSAVYSKPRYRVRRQAVRTQQRRVYRQSRRASLSQITRENRIRRAPVQLRKKPPSPKPRGKKINAQLLPQVVAYSGGKKAGTLIVDTQARFLYLVMKNGSARRYGIGVGKPGFEWAGAHKISRKAEWPTWTPPKEMIAREAAKGHHIPDFMEGGPKNPLGARALYLGSTLYRIHGTNQPWTIGKAVSSGCIRMRNEDVMDLYERVRVGAQVIVS